MAKRFGKTDRWFLGILVIVLIIICIFFYGMGDKKGAVAVVTVAGEYYGSYSLEKDCTIEIKAGDIVTNILEIHDGKADVTSAECPDHLCVHQRAISKEKETIVCLPNQVVVEIKGAEQSEFDSMT